MRQTNRDKQGRSVVVGGTLPLQSVVLWVSMSAKCRMRLALARALFVKVNCFFIFIPGCLLTVTSVAFPFALR